MPGSFQGNSRSESRDDSSIPLRPWGGESRHGGVGAVGAISQSLRSWGMAQQMIGAGESGIMLA